MRMKTLHESRCTERAARKISKLFHLDDTTWMDDMREVEKLKTALEIDDDTERDGKVVKYVMNPVPDGKGLRYRLTAVGEYRDVVALKRLNDVKRSAKAKVARMKFIRPCQNCCCFGHCTVDCQSEEYHYGGESILSKFQTDAICSYPSEWLDRSWLSQEQYEEEILSLTALDKNLVDMIASVNLDLSTVDASTLGINL